MCVSAQHLLQETEVTTTGKVGQAMHIVNFDGIPWQQQKTHKTQHKITHSERNQCVQCCPLVSNAVHSRCGGNAPRLYPEQQNTLLLVCHPVHTLQSSKDIELKL